MTHATNPMHAHHHQLGLLDKAVTFASWLLAGAVFLKVGWFAMEPDDPLGAVSVLARADGLLMLVQAGALACVAAGMATVLAGRHLADVGTFAAAIGLAAVSIRGYTSGSLLIQYTELHPGAERGLALRLAVEAVGWFGVVVLAMMASGLVMRWCFAEHHSRSGPPDDAMAAALPTLAAYDTPRLGHRLFGIPLDRRTAPSIGVKHTITATVVGVLAMTVLSAGLSSRSIQHGQACFVAAAGVGIASYIAHRFVPVRSALWSILAVPLMALAGYLWASVRPTAVDLPPNIPSSHFLRILPLQFISFGTAAALAMFWYRDDPTLEGEGRPR